MSVNTYTSYTQLPSNFPKGTSYKFDVDQMLIDSSKKTYLGSGPFYFNLKKACYLLEKEGYVFKTDSLRDRIHVFVLKHVNHETEAGFSNYIGKLQDENDVLGLTARRKQMFNTNLAELTHSQLSQVGIHLENSYDPFYSEDSEELYKSFKGVYFTENGDKGPYLIKLYEKRKPAHLVFGDDIFDNAKSVAMAMEKIDVPCTAFEYRPYLNNPENEGYRPFNLPAAALQLDELIHQRNLIEDWAAEKQSMSMQNGIEYLKDLIKRIDEAINRNILDLGI